MAAYQVLHSDEEEGTKTTRSRRKKVSHPKTQPIGIVTISSRSPTPLATVVDATLCLTLNSASETFSVAVTGADHHRSTFLQPASKIALANAIKDVLRAPGQSVTFQATVINTTSAVRQLVHISSSGRLLNLTRQQ